MLYMAVAVYSLLVCVLLFVAYSKHLFCHYTLAKTAASVGFLAVCTAAWLQAGRGQPNYFYGLMACLVLCLAGDVLLGLANTHGRFFSRFFLLGCGAFLLAHAGFCTLFSLTRAGGWRFAAAEYLPSLLALCIMLRIVRDEHRFARLRRMRLPVLAYTLFVALMCTKGITYAVALSGSPRGLLVAGGCVLFFVSDAILLFLYFYYKPRRVLRALNLITYYLSVLCLALSAGAA